MTIGPTRPQKGEEEEEGKGEGREIYLWGVCVIQGDGGGVVSLSLMMILEEGELIFLIGACELPNPFPQKGGGGGGGGEERYFFNYCDGGGGSLCSSSDRIERKWGRSLFMENLQVSIL